MSRNSISMDGLRLLNRRRFLRESVSGLSGIALASLLASSDLLAAEEPDAKLPSPIRPLILPNKPLAARSPHFAPKAKRVVMVFCSGALSHLDTWDYKPELIKRHGQPMPGSSALTTFQGENGNLSQGTAFNAAKPIRHLARPQEIGAEDDAATREFLKLLNGKHLDRFPGDTELSARIASYELAAKMQMSVPEVAGLSDESPATLRAYGADDPNPVKAAFARNCILARRLRERGVRFVQLFNGSYAMGEGIGNWDGHKTLKAQYDIHGPILDQPCAALITDLKQRGLLASTLVAFVTEFGRMPTFQNDASGRDHNPHGFTVWLTGAGVKRGFSYGATDDFGYKAVENVATIYDLHATLLHLLGLDHERLTYYHNGIERRLTDVHGEVLKDILT